MITWDTIVGIATFGGFLFGFYWLIRTDMRELSRRVDEKFDAVDVKFDEKFDAVNVKFDTVNANLSALSERLARLEERGRIG